MHTLIVPATTTSAPPFKRQRKQRGPALLTSRAPTPQQANAPGAKHAKRARSWQQETPGSMKYLAVRIRAGRMLLGNRTVFDTHAIARDFGLPHETTCLPVLLSVEEGNDLLAFCTQRQQPN
eukprot:6204792-Pleurochrysis_carterae.AAC.2